MHFGGSWGGATAFDPASSPLRVLAAIPPLCKIHAEGAVLLERGQPTWFLAVLFYGLRSSN